MNEIGHRSDHIGNSSKLTGAGVGAGMGIVNKWGNIMKLMSGKTNGKIKEDNLNQAPKMRVKGRARISKSVEISKNQRLISSYLSSE